VILRLAVSVELGLVTDGQTDILRQLIPALASVVRVKTAVYAHRNGGRPNTAKIIKKAILTTTRKAVVVINRREMYAVTLL